MHGLDRRKGVAALVPAAAAAALIALTLVQPGQATPRATSATCTQHGTVTFGVAGGAIPALDPNTIASAAQWTIQPLLYNGLTKYAHDGSVLPDLALRWKHSADLKTWWFFLRHGVKYADGRPFTAKDVVANVTRVLDPATASQARGNIKDVQSVRAIGDYEVRFKTGSAELDLPGSGLPHEDERRREHREQGSEARGQRHRAVPGRELHPRPDALARPEPELLGPEAVLQQDQLRAPARPDVNGHGLHRRQARPCVPGSDVGGRQDQERQERVDPQADDDLERAGVGGRHHLAAVRQRGSPVRPSRMRSTARPWSRWRSRARRPPRSRTTWSTRPTRRSTRSSPPTRSTSTRRSSSSRRQAFSPGRRSVPDRRHARVDDDGRDPAAGPEEDRPRPHDRPEGREHVSRRVLPAGQVLSRRDRRELPLAPAEPGPHARLPHLGQVRVQLEQRAPTTACCRRRSAAPPVRRS